MITDADLVDTFREEYARTQDLLAAVVAVRLMVQAHLLAPRRWPGPIKTTLTNDQAARVIGLVAAEVGTGVEDLLSHSCRACRRGRWVCAAVLRLCGASYPRIGRWIGAADHSQPLLAVRKVTADPELTSIRDRVISRFRAASASEAA